MKYALYGAGSLGIVLSAVLARGGEEFDIIDRNKKSVDALNKNGAKVIGKENFTQTVHAVLDSEVDKKYDIIFLLTKQINNHETILKASKMLSKNGVICTMQNGLPEKDVAEVLGSDRTFGCAVGWGATRTGFGMSELTSEPKREYLTFSVGGFGGQKNEYLDEIVRILSIMGDVSVEDNFIGARWVKLLINSSFSGMSAVCGDTFGAVAKRKDSRRVVQKIIKECIDVAHAANIKIEKIQGKNVEKLLNYNGKFKKAISFMIIPLAIKKHANLKASMLQDIEKGILCEIDSINGIVSQYGKEYKVATAANDKLIDIVHRIERQELEPSFENVKLFDEVLGG